MFWRSASARCFQLGGGCYTKAGRLSRQAALISGDDLSRQSCESGRLDIGVHKIIAFEKQRRRSMACDGIGHAIAEIQLRAMAASLPKFLECLMGDFDMGRREVDNSDILPR